MENASKALLMAASVLIGILILSLAVYLFVSFGSTSAEMHQQIETQQIAQFNSQFTSYEVKNCTIYDIVTVANLATENNIYYELPNNQPNNYYISVKKGNTSIEYGYGSTTEEIRNRYNELIKEDLENIQNKVDENNNNSPKLKTYQCKAKINPTTKRVNSIFFSEMD